MTTAKNVFKDTKDVEAGLRPPAASRDDGVNDGA